MLKAFRSATLPLSLNSTATRFAVSCAPVSSGAAPDGPSHPPNWNRFMELPAPALAAGLPQQQTALPGTQGPWLRADRGIRCGDACRPGASRSSAPGSGGPHRAPWPGCCSMRTGPSPHSSRRFLPSFIASGQSWARPLALIHEFRRLLRERQHESLDAWVQLAQERRSPWRSPTLLGTCRRIGPAVVEAVKGVWSNGQVEGQINRLKADQAADVRPGQLRLLRQRVLHAS